MELVVALFGVTMVVMAFADMTNTMIATRTNRGRWWLTLRFYQQAWRVLRYFARRGSDIGRRERFLSVFAPTSLLLLLTVWVSQQILGFALLWWAMGGLDGGSSIGDSIYYSGVVFFTVGFGDIVPSGTVPRVGTIVEAFAGVLSIALVVSYLPGLLAAYAKRERYVMTLDDGGDGKITPTNLVLARAPGRTPTEMFSFFSEWEMWVSEVIGTHSAYPMLAFFRSHYPDQNWVTALSLVTDSALECQMMEEGNGREPYWLIRRTTTLVRLLTEGADLSSYQLHYETPGELEEGVFDDRYNRLSEAGFQMLPRDEAFEIVTNLRREYAPGLVLLSRQLMVPPDFWGHGVGEQRKVACIID